MKILTIILCLALALAQCGLSPAWADAVAVPDAPPPAVEPIGPALSDLAFQYQVHAPPGDDLAMLYHVPTDGTDFAASAAATPPPSRPLALSAGTGADTRVAIDPGAACQLAEDRGWSPWAKAVVWVAVAAAVVGVGWAIAEASHGGGSDSGEHMTIDIRGNGNEVNVRDHSPSSSTSATSTTTSTTTSSSPED